MRSIPTARARATTASSSVAKSGKSRWQWLSMSIVVLLRRATVRLDITRKDRSRRRELCPPGDAMLSAEKCEAALALRDRQQIEQFASGRRHERLTKDR